MANRYSPSFRSALILGLCSLCLSGALPSHADPPLPKGFKSLAAAIMKDDPVAIERLLTPGLNINTPVEDGKSVLFLAVVYQRLKAATFLIAHGADVRMKDREGKTPLHWAVSVSTPLTSLLLEKGAEVDAVDKSGETPLYQAILHDPARALILLDHGAHVRIQNNKFETPLHIAVFGPEEVPVAKKLLEQGADVNAVDQDGQTPLDQTFNAEMTAFLTAHGAMHGIREIATQTSSPLITTLPPSPTPIVLTTRLHRAIDADDLYAVQTLLARGADVNAPDVGGSSPLAIALRVNFGPTAPTPPNPVILQTLFSKGANIHDSEPNRGQSLLIRAVLLQQPASRDWLLARGANVKNRDSQLGATALNYADDPATIRALVKRGANIDAQDNAGFTALMTNARAGETEAVRTLLTLHAHVNLKNKQGETALSLARTTQKRNPKQDRSAIIRLLKQAGAK